MKFRKDVGDAVRNLGLMSHEEVVFLLVKVRDEIVRRWPGAKFNLEQKMDDQMVSAWRCGHCAFFYFNWSIKNIPSDCDEWFWKESERLTRGTTN